MGTIKSLIYSHLVYYGKELACLAGKKIHERTGWKVYFEKVGKVSVPAEIMSLLDKCSTEPSQAGVISTNESATFETQFYDLIAYTNNFYKKISNYVDAGYQCGKISLSEAEKIKQFFESIKTKIDLIRII